MTPENYSKLLEQCGIKSLASLQMSDKGKSLDLYARILTFKPASRSLGGARDYKISLALTDPTLNYTITANIFKSQQESLPKASEDRIIVFKDIKLSTFGAHLQLVGNKDTHFTVFDYKTCKEHRTEDADLSYYSEIVEALADWTKIEVEKYSTKNVNTNIKKRSRPILQTDELIPNPDKYLDYVGMVVAFHPEVGARRTLLILTDYTENPEPFIANSDIDDAKEGIDHKLLLQCTLFDDQSDKCPALKFGDFVYLTNCDKKHKVCLEIAIRGKKDSKSNVHIIAEPDKEPKLQKLLERKRNYTPIIKRKRVRTPEPLEVATSTLRTTVKDLNTWTSIRNVLRKEIDVSEKCLIRTFISDYKPRDIKKWIRGWCTDCQRSSEISSEWCLNCKRRLKPVYQFCLMFEDNEGMKLTAYGFDEDAEELFTGISASEVLNDDTLFQRFSQIIKLASKKKSTESFDFGIKSYITASGERKYRVCNTTFVLEEDY